MPSCCDISDILGPKAGSGKDDGDLSLDFALFTGLVSNGGEGGKGSTPGTFLFLELGCSDACPPVGRPPRAVRTAQAQL